MIYNPIVEILSITPIEGGQRVVCQFDSPYVEPVAPGGLYENARSGDVRYPVHRAISRDSNILTFESFGPSADNPPLVGEKYFYRSWWLPAAMEAALDTTITWIYREYPDNGDHNHCLFTWQTIAAYVEPNHGYYNDEYGWISEMAYHDFIQNDIYKLRVPFIA